MDLLIKALHVFSDVVGEKHCAAIKEILKQKGKSFTDFAEVASIQPHVNESTKSKIYQLNSRNHHEWTPLD